MDRVVTYYEHEEQMARMERTNRRSWFLCIILIISLIATNAGWLWYESQFEYYEIQQEAMTEGGGDAFVNNGGDFNYGTGQTSSEGQTEESGR